jgi:hypothetical protein
MDSGDTTLQDFSSKFHNGKNTQSLSELVKEKFVRAGSEKVFYSPRLALTPLEKEAVLEQMPNVFSKKIEWRDDHKGRDDPNWRDDHIKIVRDLIPKQENEAGVSVVTRNKLTKDGPGDEERKTICTLGAKRSLSHPKPSSRLGEDSLLEGENESSAFTVLGAQKRFKTEGITLEAEFAR